MSIPHTVELVSLNLYIPHSTFVSVVTGGYYFAIIDLQTLCHAKEKQSNISNWNMI